MGKQVTKYADVAMYDAVPDPMADAGFAVEPQVYLVNMTEDPLRVMAAASELYAGQIVHDPRMLEREVCERWFRDMTRTKLQAPLEFIDLHFLFEGVT